MAPDRDRLLVVARYALLGVACVELWLVVRRGLTFSGDYQPLAAVSGDNAGPALTALVHAAAAVGLAGGRYSLSISSLTSSGVGARSASSSARGGRLSARGSSAVVRFG